MISQAMTPILCFSIHALSESALQRGPYYCFMLHLITKEKGVSYGLSLLVCTFVFANMVIAQLLAYPERDCWVGLDFLRDIGECKVSLSLLL